MLPGQIAALEALARRTLTPQELIDIEALLVPGDFQGVANILSVGRTRKVPTEVGKGTILEVLGLAAANGFLDIIDNGADYRHAKHLLTDGRLRLDSPLVENLLAGFVAGGALTQAQADSLLTLAVQPDLVSWQDVSLALS